MAQADSIAFKSFRKCSELFPVQDVCHVLREHESTTKFIGPRFLSWYTAALEMHTLDPADRLEDLKNSQGIGYCNITSAAPRFCRKGITSAGHADHPLRNAWSTAFYDPLRRSFVSSPEFIPLVTVGNSHVRAQADRQDAIPRACAVASVTACL